MTRSRSKIKGRRENGRFLAIPERCYEHPNFTNMSPKAVKLFIDLLSQYNGFNNGDLCASWTVMRKKNWRSKATLHDAITELRKFNWIIVSRQGGRNRASLYALTFHSIDECKGKLEIDSTNVAPGDWKDTVETARHKG